VTTLDGREAVVLGYHRVGSPPKGSWETWFSVPEETFVEQLRALVVAGWEPVAVDAFVQGLDEPARLPARAVLLTFDDAFKSLTGSALRVLTRLGYPAAVFVPVGHVGATNAWDADTAHPTEPLCSWDDLRELERAGISVQSHALSHRRLSTLDRAAREREVEESKATLERELDKPVELLAYPYGDSGPEEDDVGAVAACAGYRAAFMFGGARFSLPVEDRFHLPRVAVGPDTDLESELGRVA
jgi:peptidoglycan/xylan/chitin deacetylase (PgdA/CDA1 family)